MFKQGCSAFRVVTPNIDEEASMMEDMGMQDVHFNEVCLILAQLTHVGSPIIDQIIPSLIVDTVTLIRKPYKSSGTCTVLLHQHLILS